MARLKVGVRMLASVGIVALLTSGFTPFVSAQEQARIDAQSKISAELKLEAENASATEKIPVYIWTTDIDHEEVEIEVEETLGFSKEAVGRVELMGDSKTTDVSRAVESQEAFASLYDGEVNADIIEYLEETQPQRKKAQQQAEAYVTKQREFEKAEYAKLATATVDSLGIDEEDIVFTSRYAPMTIALMTAEEIEAASYDSAVQSLSTYEEMAVAEVSETATDDFADMRASNGIDTIHETTGLTGQGVRVGIVEGGSIYEHNELPSERFTIVGIPYYSNDAFSTHATNVARVMVGNMGVAPEASLFSCSIDRGAYTAFMGPINFYAATELLIDNSVSVINCSWGGYEVTAYSDVDQWLDHVSMIHSVTFVDAAGNDGTSSSHHISAPGNAYNIITVGAFNGKGTAEKSDDELFNYSSYIDTGAVNKPDLVAPANMGCGGTSSAAPFVTGIVALMLELRPSLAFYPEAVKAILMASCLRKVISTPQESMSTTGSSLTERQGAGAVDAYIAIAITGAGHYGTRTITGGQVSEDVRVYQPAYGASGMSVAMTWLRENTVSGSAHESGTITVGTAFDMDLQVLRGTTSLVSCSSTNTSAEFAHISSLSGGNSYTFRLKKYTSTEGSVRCAYAWGIDTDRFQRTAALEGIYYLKNGYCQSYMKMDPSSLNITQNAYTATASYRWIVKKNTNNTYQIISANASYGTLGMGTALDTINYGASVKSSGTNNLVLEDNGDGSYRISMTVSGKTYYLESNELGTGERIVWTTLPPALKGQSWYLEPYALMRGDVDANGTISSADYTAILDYAAGRATPNNQQTFLADIDGNGTVNTTDARLTLQIVNGVIV